MVRRVALYTDMRTFFVALWDSLRRRLVVIR